VQTIRNCELRKNSAVETAVTDGNATNRSATRTGRQLDEEALQAASNDGQQHHAGAVKEHVHAG
jgi:hypothetical protein